MVIAGLVLAFAATAHAATDVQLINEASETKALFTKTDPGLAAFFDRAPGYVIFPGIGKAGIGIGGAHGSGVLYQHGEPIGKATVNQVSVGAQLGAQQYSEVIFFATPQAMAGFMRGTMKLTGEVSAVALKSGASANAKYQDGVVVFTATKAGLMLEAAVAGQKFSYEPFVVVKK
jgi:lipid-binding SYLF domain-containing protein